MSPAAQLRALRAGLARQSWPLNAWDLR